MKSIKAAFWRTCYARWRTPAPPEREGLSILLPVPADLPVFLRLALGVLEKQDTRCVREALVIPDAESPGFTALFEAAAREFRGPPLRLVRMRALDRALVRLLRNGHNNHFLQLVNGIEQASASHALLHDADAFLHDPKFVAQLYERCLAGDLDAFGVGEAWDPWLRERDLAHVTATWELLMRVAWVRSFAPHLHRGHTDDFRGEAHVFDTTLLPQALTPGERIAHIGLDKAAGFVHFNFVIVTYRRFQKATAPFEDDNFRLLLIRALIDAFGPRELPSAVPALDELARGLTRRDARVTYTAPQTAPQYAIFRAKLAELIACGLLGDAECASLAASVSAWDRHFGWREHAATQIELAPARAAAH